MKKLLYKPHPKLKFVGYSIIWGTSPAFILASTAGSTSPEGDQTVGGASSKEYIVVYWKVRDISGKTPVLAERGSSNDDALPGLYTEPGDGIYIGDISALGDGKYGDQRAIIKLIKNY